jgi:hypothetical protein
MVALKTPRSSVGHIKVVRLPSKHEARVQLFHLFLWLFNLFTWGFCFSLKGNPNRTSEQGFGTVLAQLGWRAVGVNPLVREFELAHLLRSARNGAALRFYLSRII